MTAFVIATAKIKDKDKFGEYGKAAGETVVAHGGSVIRRGQYNATLAGNRLYNASAILEFPDIEALNGWYNSTDYQAIIPLRNEACEMTITSHTVPAT